MRRCRGERKVTERRGVEGKIPEVRKETLRESNGRGEYQRAEREYGRESDGEREKL